MHSEGHCVLSPFLWLDLLQLHCTVDQYYIYPWIGIDSSKSGSSPFSPVFIRKSLLPSHNGTHHQSLHQLPLLDLPIPRLHHHQGIRPR